ncbi:hypothetical protein DENSPDRAFT_226109 [Dentipellis sp. KUC8613]|nr:hypothetical protein DENSPDRAFT_226109 [Dentipellis sp. KUC8613]
MSTHENLLSNEATPPLGGVSGPSSSRCMIGMPAGRCGTGRLIEETLEVEASEVYPEGGTGTGTGRSNGETAGEWAGLVPRAGGGGGSGLLTLISEDEEEPRTWRVDDGGIEQVVEVLQVAV